ncbi:MAG: PHP domain-containing protein [Acidimicrobiia bacterium]|nr:PHP domain-containing protein [Acidimicrobiia bacterium]
MTTTVMTPTEALRRAIYYLDRELAPSTKIRAFQRAIDVVEQVGPTEVAARAEANTLTELAGIGASTGSVITDAVLGRQSSYLADLDARSRVEVGAGAALLAALRGDCHAHSTWSDGGAPVREMAETARALGHDYLVITDHSPRLTIAHGLSEERLAEQLIEVAALNTELAPFRILTGVEVDILVDGSLDLPDEVLADLDLVVASVHSKLKLSAPEMTRRMVLAVANPHVDILGHCTNRKIVGTGRPPSRFDSQIVWAACARFETAVEINCRPERLDPPAELLDELADWDVPIAINTDAHAPGQLEWQAYGCDKAAAAGIEADRIVNTWDLDRLQSWAASHPTE